MQIKYLDATTNSENGYEANLDAVVSGPFGSVDIVIHVKCSEGSPINLAKCIIGMADDLADVLLDAEQIDRRSEDF